MKNEEKAKEQLIKESAKLHREYIQVKEETKRKKKEKTVVQLDETFKNLIDSFNEVIYRANPKTLHATFVIKTYESSPNRANNFNIWIN
ncbi:MAG: hypothetical protein JSW20_01835 [Nitrospiraceae bacterium]|nr:MAG: hypothetical protein JSW20_01835 [Nitrospiraceae bacterium]